jgi:hypothetical protein
MMPNIPKSYLYLVILVFILLAYPFVSGFVMSKRVKNNPYTLEPTFTPATKMNIPDHKTLVIDSYKYGFTFYGWWSNTDDTLVSNDKNKLLNNPYYFKQTLTGDIFTIQYLPVLKKYLESISQHGNRPKEERGTLATECSFLGKAPEKLIIKGGDVQICPIFSTPAISYEVQQGSLSLGIRLEEYDHFDALSKSFPGLPIGLNHQPDWDNTIISPATVLVGEYAGLFIKDGYNAVKTKVITVSNSYINLENPQAHLQITWALADSTYIHCNEIQEAWFREKFPNTILNFTPAEGSPFFSK